MKIKSALVTQISGSIGGMTGAHNRGGLYLRARAIPVNPSTGYQQQVRSALTALVNRWTTILTAAQRVAWNLYGANVSVIDKLGDTRFLTGQQWYLACNTPRNQYFQKYLINTVPIVDDAPTLFDRGDFTTPSFAMDAVTGLTVTFDNTDDWANEDDAMLLLYQGCPVNGSRGFFKGPYRLLTSIAGNATTAPTSPAVFAPAALAAVGFPIAEAQANWLGVAVTRADGRLTTRRILGPTLTTP